LGRADRISEIPAQLAEMRGHLARLVSHVESLGPLASARWRPTGGLRGAVHGE
jgi:hypothetical protein